MTESLEQRLFTFLSGFPGAESIDVLAETIPALAGKKADYLLDDRRIVFEVKSLNDDPSYKIGEKIKQLESRPDFPLFYWKVPLSVVLSKMPDGEELHRDLFHAITRSVQAGFEKANKQILATKQALGIPNACGVLCVLNEAIEVLDPEMIGASVHRMFSKKKPNGDMRYEHIAAVLLISESHRAKIGQVQGRLIMLINGPNSHKFSELGYLEKFNASWAEHERSPYIDGGQIKNLSEVSFEPTKAQTAATPTGPMRNQDLWKQEYLSAPYMRELTKEKFLEELAKAIWNFKMLITKGGPRPDASMPEIMRKSTHALAEAECRQLDMKEVTPYLRRIADAGDQP